MNTYTKQEQDKYLRKQQPDRLREAINATFSTLAVVIVCAVVTLVFWSF
ncbi:putative TMhelix containing protein [Vibrio phage 511E55-1]|nr:putative TMhelix containing protein [Vibrio phage 511E55-1]